MNGLEQFLDKVSVLDTETTNLIAEQSEIVEIACTTFSPGGLETDSLLLGAYGGIPPEASAKNNISRRMIEGLPKFDQVTRRVKGLMRWDDGGRYFVAHNASYDRKALSAAFARIGSTEDMGICGDDSRWICTWRLGKQILSHQFDDIQYGLSYLRYLLDLDVPDDVGVHRAGADTVVCARLLERLIQMAIERGQIDPTGDVGAELNLLCWSHIPVRTWPFGKHRGVPLEDIPNDYYIWALKNVNSLGEDDPAYDADLAESVRQLLEKRLSA